MLFLLTYSMPFPPLLKLYSDEGGPHDKTRLSALEPTQEPKVFSYLAVVAQPLRIVAAMISTAFDVLFFTDYPKHNLLLF